ncbi:MAG: aminotransferase class IV [Planctomycetes bacterium]|nr:aminotransferase class IV [Planctomycetota bacterium]
MPTVLVNGEFLAPGDARISAFDAGLQHAVGLFETMTAVMSGGEARVIGLDEHLARLAISAKELGLTRELNLAALEEAVVATVERDGTPRQRVRLTVTGGDLNLLAGGKAENAGPTVLVVSQPAIAYPVEMYDNGISVVVADFRANPLDEGEGHKTLNYWTRLRELRKAAAKRAGEALVFSVTNHLCGGCVSNLILVRDGQVVTPIARGEETEGSSTAGPGPAGVRLRAPVLPGITRSHVLDWASGLGLKVTKRLVSIDDLLKADEVVVTNSSFGVLPVTRLEREMIGGGSVGPITQQWVANWREQVDA